jgi:hypothetical protein
MVTEIDILIEGIAVLRGARDAISRGYRVFKMHPRQVVGDGQEACVIWRCEAANRNGVPIAGHTRQNLELEKRVDIVVPRVRRRSTIAALRGSGSHGGWRID